MKSAGQSSQAFPAPGPRPVRPLLSLVHVPVTASAASSVRSSSSPAPFGHRTAISHTLESASLDELAWICQRSQPQHSQAKSLRNRSHKAAAGAAMLATYRCFTAAPRSAAAILLKVYVERPFWARARC
ncbi:hypothetical protein VTO73DRAFT_9527 [Trametes versicolor]